MKKYWIIIGKEQKGPFDFEELSKYNISPKSKVWYNGIKDWTVFESLPDFLEYQNYIKEQTIKKKKNSNKLFLIIIAVIFVSILSFFLFNKFSFTEEMAKKETERLFSLLSLENPNQDELEKIYPNYSKIGQRLLLKEKIEINNVSKNSLGNYDVFATYNKKIPITIEVTRENFENKILSSKGLSYYYYNEIRNYGIKKGCLTGNENDIELGIKVKNKDLESNLNIDTAAKIAEYYDNIKKDENIYETGGYFPTLSGNVTITNNNNVYLDYSSIKCNLLMLDSNGNVIESSPLYFFNTIRPHSSESARVYSTIPNGASKYRVEFDVNISKNISNLLKQEVISNVNKSCK